MGPVGATPARVAPADADEWVDVTPPTPEDEEWTDVGGMPPDTFERRTLTNRSARTASVAINTPDPISRFMRGVGTELGVMPAQLTELFSGPVPPPLKILMGLGKSLYTNPRDEGTAAGEAFGAGDTSRGVGHLAAAFLPLLGKPAADVGEAFADEDNLAGAAGRATGLIGPMLLGGTRTEPATTPPGRVPLTVADRSGGTVARLTENVMEHSLPGAAVFRPFRQKQLDAVRKIGTDIADQIARDPGSVERLGFDTKRQIARVRVGITREAARIESQVDAVATPRRQSMRIRDPETGAVLPPDPNSPTTAGREFVSRKNAPAKGGVAQPATGAWVDTSSWKRLGDQLNQIATDPHRVMSEPHLADLRKLTAELRGAPRSLPWDSARRTREAARALLAKIPDADITRAVPGLTAEKIARTLDREMDVALETAGGRPLVYQWHAARQLREEAQAAYLDGVLTRLEEAKPESVHRLLTSDVLALDDVRVMSRHLGRGRMRELVGTNIRDTLAAHWDDPVALAKALDDQFRDGKMSIALANPQVEAAIRTFIEDAAKVKPPAGAVSQFSVGNTLLGIGGIMSPKALLAIPGFYVTSRLLTSPAPWVAARNALARGGMGLAGAGVVTRGARSATDTRPATPEEPRQRGSIQ